MSKFKHFLGIDVSKEYFDAVIILNNVKEKLFTTNLQTMLKESDLFVSG